MGITINKYESCSEATDEAVARLIGALDHPVKTLFLLSGGSSLDVARKVFPKLKADQKRLITVAQIDERYGEPGHPDSNWNGIEEAVGSFDDYAGAVNILQGSGSIEEDTANYNARLRELLVENVMKIGLFGIGADGHVAGILPHEEADFMKYTDGRMVVNFQGTDFPRITTTSALMKVLDGAIVYACGENKEDTVDRLNKTLLPHQHPAQLLKETNETWVYFGRGKQ